MPKELRAELHERFASHLEQTPGGSDEIVGYHFEQAYRNRAELGPPGEDARALSNRAGALLAGAARRGLNRGDVSAAENLADRAAALLPDGLQRMQALHVLAEACPVERNDEVCAEIRRTAGATHDEALIAWARVARFLCPSEPRRLP